MSAPRRRFLTSLAAAPLLPAAIVDAQTPAAQQPAPSPAPVPAPSSEADPVAGALTEVVRLRFGAHFEGSDDLAAVREEIGRNLQGAVRLRALGLRNADEPVTVFSARVPGSRKPRGEKGAR
jgi:hypothetical protein